MYFVICQTHATPCSHLTTSVRHDSTMPTGSTVWSGDNMLPRSRASKRMQITREYNVCIYLYMKMYGHWLCGEVRPTKQPESRRVNKMTILFIVPWLTTETNERTNKHKRNAWRSSTCCVQIQLYLRFRKLLKKIKNKIKIQKKNAILILFLENRGLISQFIC